MIRLSRCLPVLASLLCFSATAAEPAPIVITTIALERQTTGTYYIDSELQGYGTLDMLVDTGSSYLVIDNEVLSELQKQGAATYSHDLEGIMANGSRTTIPLYRLAGIRLGKACWIANVEAAVFPQATRAILGMNVLTRLAPFTFTTDPPALALNQCRDQATPALASRDADDAIAAAISGSSPRAAPASAP